MAIILNDKEVRDIYEAIGGISGQPFDFKLSYRLSKIAGQLETHFMVTEKNRSELIKNYSTKKPMHVDEDKINEFMEAWDKALTDPATEQNYDNIALIPGYLFEGTKLPVAFLKNIDKLIDAETMVTAE